MADEIPRQRTLYQTDEFTAQYDELIKRHSVALVGRVLDGIFWGISTNPSVYDRVVGTIRQARSRSMGATIPRFRVWFQIQHEGQENESVLLLWIEEMNPIDEIFGYQS